MSLDIFIKIKGEAGILLDLEIILFNSILIQIGMIEIKWILFYYES
ncbi:hypothetical protein [Caloranaerobacter ferrireducens]|nr:hypothetical protein [Caloranaerobacter ferrireducens]